MRKDIEARARGALDDAAAALPRAFPQAIVDAVGQAVTERLGGLKLTTLR